jgi:predicted pyridoxine 5'-phosphate oxidase superfamily flavin-nucleotide-binding protein
MGERETDGPRGPMYHEAQRALQDRYGTRRLADRLVSVIVHDTFTDEERAFIEARDMLFLATVDGDGQPTVSYKGGAPGFVRVEDNELVVPCYDGNGMFLSTGNVAASARVGVLFIDFETPNRLRVDGVARLDDGAAKERFPGALFLIRIRPARIFVNCARYVHTYRRTAESRHVPGPDGGTTLAAWKRLDAVRDTLPDVDRARAEAEGALSQDEYHRMLARGET